MKTGIVIVDYGMGNLRSVEKAFVQAGSRPQVSDKPRDIERAGKIVLPGVGAFDQAVDELKKRKLFRPLQEKIKAGTPYLGICLGLQLLFTWSEEGTRARGLDILPGVVRRFRVRLKIPHMGWNTLDWLRGDCPLFDGLDAGSYFYFVHSYYGDPEDHACDAARTRYGIRFPSAVWNRNIFATQFHPEKSQALGLKLVRNFIRWAGPC